MRSKSKVNISHYHAQTPKPTRPPVIVNRFVTAEYVQRFATKEAVDAAAEKEEEGEDEEMSDIGSISEEEDQVMDE